MGKTPYIAPELEKIIDCVIFEVVSREHFSRLVDTYSRMGIRVKEEVVYEDDQRILTYKPINKHYAICKELYNYNTCNLVYFIQVL